MPSPSLRALGHGGQGWAAPCSSAPRCPLCMTRMSWAMDTSVQRLGAPLTAPHPHSPPASEPADPLPGVEPCRGEAPLFRQQGEAQSPKTTGNEGGPLLRGYWLPCLLAKVWAGLAEGPPRPQTTSESP